MANKVAVFRPSIWVDLLAVLIPFPILYPHASWWLYIFVPGSLVLALWWGGSIHVTDSEVIGPRADLGFFRRNRIPLAPVTLGPPPDFSPPDFTIATTAGDERITPAFLSRKERVRLLRTLNLAEASS